MWNGLDNLDPGSNYLSVTGVSENPDSVGNVFVWAALMLLIFYFLVAVASYIVIMLKVKIT